MIDWKIEYQGNMFYSEEGWYFDNFSIQEYLLPMINIGFEYIDKYNDTSFLKDDCKRLIENIKNIETILESRKEIINFDSLVNGDIKLSKNKIEKCIIKGSGLNYLINPHIYGYVVKWIDLTSIRIWGEERGFENRKL